MWKYMQVAHAPTMFDTHKKIAPNSELFKSGKLRFSRIRKENVVFEIRIKKAHVNLAKEAISNHFFGRQLYPHCSRKFAT